MAALMLFVIGVPEPFAREVHAGAQWSYVAVSADGNCRLAYQTIDGQVEFQCAMAGRERWRRQLRLVPEQGFVTDDGGAVLTGTRLGRGLERGRRQSYFVIAILDPHGQLLQYQHVMQRWRGTSHGGGKPHPCARGLMVDAASNVAVVRLSGNLLESREW